MKKKLLLSVICFMVGLVHAGNRLVIGKRVEEKQSPQTKFFNAAICGELIQMQRLFKKGDIDINARDSVDECTALMHASLAGWIDVIEWLLQQKDIDVTLVSTSGKTAAAFAQENGVPRCLELLKAHLPH